MAKGERWILPDQIVLGIWDKLDDRTGLHGEQALLHDLEKYIKGDELLRKRRILLGYNKELPSARNMKRYLSKTGDKPGYYIRRSGFDQRVTNKHLLNILCLWLHIFPTMETQHVSVLLY